MQTLMDGLRSVDLTHTEQVSEMTLKHRFSLVLLLIFSFIAISPGLALAQLPFGDLTPTEDELGEDEGPLPGAPFEEEGPVRPIDRPPIRPRPPARPQDDELGDDEEPVQSVEVKERFAGWEGAGDLDGERLADTLRANWVMLDRNGEFTGTVRGIDNVDVAGMTIFLMSNGRLVKTAAVQGDGSFMFTNVQRGAYSLVGWSDKAFFAFGANIINDNPDADDSTPTSINCYAFQNETTINTDWIRFFAPNIAYRVFGRYSSGETEDDPDSLYGFEGLTQHTVPAEPATSIAGTPVLLNGEGRFMGRVHQMNSINGRPVDLRSTKVMLLKDDDVIGSTTTDNFGVFQFSGVRPGGYGLLAVGVDGVGLVAVEAVGDTDSVLDEEGFADDDDPVGANFDFTMVSAETVGWLNHYASEVAYRKALLRPRRQQPQQQAQNDPVCPSCNGRMGPNGCPRCGSGATDEICNSPCITYGEWVARGCACREREPAWRRISDRILERANDLDDRFESSFYGDGEDILRELGTTGATGGGANGGIQGSQGFAGGGGSGSRPAASGSGSQGAAPLIVPAPLPPIVQPNTVPLSLGSGTR